MFIKLGLMALNLFGVVKPSWTQSKLDRWSRAVGIVIAAILILALLGMGTCAIRQDAVQDYLGERAQDNQDARDRADQNALEVEERNTKTQEEIAQAQAEAAAKDPEGASRPVGPVSQSYYDNLPEDDR